MKNKLTRIELYNLIWNEPISKLSIRIGRDRTDIKKACADYNIPIPMNGHWSRIRFNKPIQKIPLPSDRKFNEVIEFHEKLYQTQKVGIIKKVYTDEEQKRFAVKDRLSNPDPIVLRARNVLVLKQQPSYRYPGMIETPPDLLDIRVTAKTASRALRFFDAFIKLARKRAHNIELGPRASCININGMRIEFFMREIRNRTLNTSSSSTWDRYDYHLSGKLSFRLRRCYEFKLWSDGKLKLEDQLFNIMNYLELKAQSLLIAEKNHAEINRIRREELEEKERLANEKKEEFVKTVDFVKEAIYWKLSQFVEDYVNQIKSGSIMENKLKSSVQIEWALKKASWLNPLSNSKDDLLDDAMRSKLFEELTKKLK